VGALLNLSVGVARGHFQAELQQRCSLASRSPVPCGAAPTARLADERQLQQELFPSPRAWTPARKVLVGATDDEDLVAKLLRHDRPYTSA